MSKTEQSSVEWLVNVVQSCIAPDYIPIEIVKQAKAMHKEEIINAANWDSKSISENGIRKGDKYYNQIYGGNNE